jgi:hypothetical protein
MKTITLGTIFRSLDDAALAAVIRHGETFALRWAARQEQRGRRRAYRAAQIRDEWRQARDRGDRQTAEECRRRLIRLGFPAPSKVLP